MSDSETEDSPASSPRPPPPQIEGLKVIDAETLRDSDFSRFHNDNLYFIDFVTFIPTPTDNDLAKTTLKPIDRVLALTPAALFVTNFDGALDRATRYDDVTEIFVQKKITKRLFGSDTWMHLVLKVPTEVDWHIAFEISKDFPESRVTDLTDAIGKLWKYHTERRAAEEGTIEEDVKSALPVHQLADGADISDKIAKTANADYVPPEEIRRRNNEERMFKQRIDTVSQEVLQLQRQVEDMRASAVAKQKELKELEAKYGVDLSQLRNQKQLLLQRQSQLSKQVTNSEMELGKMQGEVQRLREQLDEERSNYETLVKQQIDQAGSQQDEQQHQMMLLRQKAQKKEIARVAEKYQSVLDQLTAHQPKYDGSAALVQLAQELESKIQSQLIEWNQKVTSSNKIEKFLDAVNAEIARTSGLIADANDAKDALVSQRQGPPPSQSQQHTSSASLLDDDFLVPNTSVTALPPSSRSLPDVSDDIYDMDDILASPPSQQPSKSAPPAASSHVDPLDDLLDGPTPSTQQRKSVEVDLDDF